VDQIVYAIQQFGFPIVIAVGLGYFVYYVWRTIIKVINPAIKKMHFALIKLIDQIRMLDNDMIRLQEKVDTVLQMKENENNNRNTTISRNDGDSR
jgi:predicted PurR-regulated permease PerM